MRKGPRNETLFEQIDRYQCDEIESVYANAMRYQAMLQRKRRDRIELSGKDSSEDDRPLVEKPKCRVRVEVRYEGEIEHERARTEAIRFLGFLGLASFQPSHARRKGLHEDNALASAVSSRRPYSSGWRFAILRLKLEGKGKG